MDKQREAAKLGGLQDHSIGGPYPYIVVGIANPSFQFVGGGGCLFNGAHDGTFFYVQNPDGTIGSRLYKRAEDAANVASMLKTSTTLQPREFDRLSWWHPVTSLEGLERIIR